MTHFIVLAAFVLSCGGQWYLLQGIAWIKMIHDYSQTAPLIEAVSMTLSGQYPCAICKAIEEKKQSENNNLCSLEKFEKKYFPPAAIAPACLLVSAIRFPGFVTFLSSRLESPPTPPPRLVLA